MDFRSIVLNFSTLERIF